MKKIYTYAERWKWNVIEKSHCFRERARTSLENQEGVGVVEVILILVVLIGLVLIFKEQLTSLVESIFEKIVDESSGI